MFRDKPYELCGKIRLDTMMMVIRFSSYHRASDMCFWIRHGVPVVSVCVHLEDHGPVLECILFGICKSLLHCKHILLSDILKYRLSIHSKVHRIVG